MAVGLVEAYFMIYPSNYRNLLGSAESTEKAIKYVKDMFQENLSAQLTLLRVTAPMVVLSGTGLNDDRKAGALPCKKPRGRRGRGGPFPCKMETPKTVGNGAPSRQRYIY